MGTFMASPSQPNQDNNTPLTGLARQMVRHGLLDEESARQAQREAPEQKTSLVHYVVQNSMVRARPLAEMLSRQFGIPLIDLGALENPDLASEALSAKLIYRYRLLPIFQRGNRLFVAISDPSDEQPLRDAQFSTQLLIEPVLADDDRLDGAIDKMFQGSERQLDILDQAEFAEMEDDSAAEEEAGDDTPVVRYVYKLLLDAINGGASDLHFEPYESKYRVRFRIDGILHEVSRPPKNLSNRLAARLKIMANLDISERRKPQDGRIKLRVSNKKSIDFRVSVLPTLWGEKVVMRILDSDSARLGIDSLGYEDDQKELYLWALHQPQGMILVTGPTGSGKTVSLYTGLNILNTPDVNISTAEDPVEIQLDGINQVNINTKAGLTFAGALRSFLRQDPDIVMVGEIRDLETADIAIKASQTGHLVLSTLHTNGAAETLTRLVNMGVEPFNIASSLHLIIAQRLVRRLCTHCRAPQDLPEEVLRKEGFPADQIGKFRLYQPVGCDECNQGYKGRSGIYEVVKITPTLKQMIMEDRNAMELAEQMRKEGYNDLRTSGLIKAMKGITSLAEVNRVTKD